MSVTPAFRLPPFRFGWKYLGISRSNFIAPMEYDVAVSEMYSERPHSFLFIFVKKFSCQSSANCQHEKRSCSRIMLASKCNFRVKIATEILIRENSLLENFKKISRIFRVRGGVQLTTGDCRLEIFETFDMPVNLFWRFFIRILFINLTSTPYSKEPQSRSYPKI